MQNDEKAITLHYRIP